MAVRFPDNPQTDAHAERHINNAFDHLIACVKQGRAPGKLFHSHGLAIDTTTNQIYVAEGIYLEDFGIKFTRVSVFSETGVLLNTFSHPHLKCIYGIAIHLNNLYLTDTAEHCVFHFKVESELALVAKIGGRGSGIEQFDEPRQLAVSTNINLFVSDYKNDRLKILDSRFRFLQHISHHSMKGPSDVKLTQDEVFVLCQTSPCIKVFSYSGDLMRSLITRGDNGMQVIYPLFFCMDADGNLLISDSWSHQIKIFSKEETLLHTLGKNGHKVGMFFCPRGIALINNLKFVIVSLNRNYSIQIYSSD